MPIWTWSKTAASNATADATINWQEGMAPSAVNDSARSEMAAVAKWRDDISGALTTAGTATAFTLTTNSVFTSLANMDKALITFITNNTSGASPTLAVDGLTAKAINGPTGTAIATGALISGNAYAVVYDNTNSQFLLLNYRDTLINATVTGTLAVTGVTTHSGTVNMSGAAFNEVRTTIASATTTNIGAAAANYLQVTSTTTITAFDTVAAGIERTLEFAAALTLTHNATSLILPGGLNITTAAGDCAIFRSEGSGNWRCISYVRASNPPIGLAPTVQTFTSGSSATYTPASGLRRIRVRMCGGGAGGGGATANNGTIGNDTSFESWTAKGGSVGVANGGAGGAGGTGGTDGTGTKVVRITGGTGGVGPSATASNTAGGVGGANPLSGAGVPVVNAAGGNGTANTGAGGAGGGGTSGALGGGGGAGEYVEFWMTAAQVGASLTYTVGAAANGGSAGTKAGGNGAAGIIIIEEWYS